MFYAGCASMQNHEMIILPDCTIRLPFLQCYLFHHSAPKSLSIKKSSLYPSRPPPLRVQYPPPLSLQLQILLPLLPTKSRWTILEFQQPIRLLRNLFANSIHPIPRIHLLLLLNLGLRLLAYIRTDFFRRELNPNCISLVVVGGQAQPAQNISTTPPLLH